MNPKDRMFVTADLYAAQEYLRKMNDYQVLAEACIDRIRTRLGLSDWSERETYTEVCRIRNNSATAIVTDGEI